MNKQKIKKLNTAGSLLLIPIAFLTLVFMLHPLSFYAQNNAADLYKEYCADCHSIGEGDIMGPDLLGMEQKYSNDWLMKFIKSAMTMVNSGDPKAVAVFEKFDKDEMPDTDLPKSDIQGIINYVKSFNKSAVKKDSETITSDDEEIERQVTEGEDITATDARLNAMEKKLDIILDFHKKALSARITDEEINKGEKLFNGDVSFFNGAPACANCHNTYKIDSLNWNPSALDIAKAFSKRNDVDMSNLIINPVSEKMKEVLEDHELTDDETFYLTAYLQSIEKTGLKEHKELPWKLIIFIGLCLIIILALLDLMFTKLIKIKLINFAIIVFALIPVWRIIILKASTEGLSPNYAPDQPIKFSHKIHVKENKIECIFCHNSPEYSKESGIPTTNVCIICHNKIKSGKMTGQFEISKILKSFEDKKSIEWIRIHNLPDHVFFSHAQHYNIAKISCQTCHGKVEEMHIVEQYALLSMGWCINCHRKYEVQFEENKFYSKHNELHDDLKEGKISKVTADMIGANDCQKCHY